MRFTIVWILNGQMAGFRRRYFHSFEDTVYMHPQMPNSYTLTLTHSSYKFES